MEKTRRGSIKRKKGRIDGQFVAVEHKLLKSELMNYLRPIDIFTYVMIRSRETGDPAIDRRIHFTNEAAAPFMSTETFSMSKFRLWAFGLLNVEWGRRKRTMTRFGMSNSWKALLHRKTALQKIALLVSEYEYMFMRKGGHESNPKAKEHRWSRYLEIKREIIQLSRGDRKLSEFDNAK